jgi:hypothetical protein
MAAMQADREQHDDGGRVLRELIERHARFR